MKTKNFGRIVALSVKKPIPVAVAMTVPIHQICRDSSAAAVIPGSSGGRPKEVAPENTAKPAAAGPTRRQSSVSSRHYLFSRRGRKF